MLLLFQNPILGVMVGAGLTAIIQSSSASVGILQALSLTGGFTFSAVIPIIMGQNIGTCVTAMISSIGANRNARRTAFVPSLLQYNRYNCFHAALLRNQCGNRLQLCQ